MSTGGSEFEYACVRSSASESEYVFSLGRLWIMMAEEGGNEEEEEGGEGTYPSNNKNPML